MQVSQIRSAVFVATGALLFIIMDKALLWLWTGVDALRNYSRFGISLTSLIALVLTVGAVLYVARRDDIKSFLSEVIIELQKVTWPGMDEVKRSTLIVIIFTVLLSVFLWGSDQVWKFVTDLILTPGT